MGTPLGPKYVPYTYMDPLGFQVPLRPDAMAVPGRRLRPNVSEQSHEMDNHKLLTNWVAVKELQLSYYIGETLLFTIYTHNGNLI